MYGGERCSVVLSCLVRFGISLRGLVSYGTVLSGPVRLCKVSCFEVWSGMLDRGPVRLGQVRFGSAKQGAVLSGGVKFGLVLSCRAKRGALSHFMVRSGSAGRATVERGFVLQGKVFRGIAWLREALFRVVKFCPVKHCYVMQAKVLSWFGEVLHGVAGIGGVLYGMAKRAAALLRPGMVTCRTVEFGFVLLCAPGQGLVSLRSGVGQQGSVMRGAATCSKVW